VTVDRTRRDRLIRFAERHVSGPAMRTLLRAGLAPRAFALLETTGRRTGKKRWTPVGNGLEGHTFWLVAEQGHDGDYVKNLLANPGVRVKVGRHWHTGTAEIVPEDDGLARRRSIDERNGWVGRFDGVLFRTAAGRVLTVRIDLNPPLPTFGPSGVLPGVELADNASVGDLMDEADAQESEI
jgi:deazaflavin-dependent oxidoreductase (nitroreductase family)